MIRHGSLFSGIGGFDLAAEWMGWENVFHCEINPFGQRVLKYYWPKAISYEDITKTDFTIHRGTIDVLTGGFPCQPYSTAGKRLGKEDDRHLWPEMLRAIREIQPTWIVGENVRGLTNWNGGVVFNEVQAEMEAEGYEVTPFLLPACAVNAPHRRDRVWFIGYSNEWGRQKHGLCSRREVPKNNNNEKFVTTNPNCNGILKSQPRGCNEREQPKNKEQQRNRWTSKARRRIPGWQGFPIKSPICNGDDGLSARLDGITFSKWREESIKGGGNAIVPPLAFQIFKAIAIYD